MMIAPSPAPPQAAAPPVGGMSAPGAPVAAPAPQIPPNVVTIDAVMRLLRDNAHRRFRIDIETDSTIAGDEQAEKASRTEFIAMATKFVETWGPIVTAQPKAAPLAKELLLFGVRGFRVGRSLENEIEEFGDALEQAAGIPKPPPQPSPDELMKYKATEAKTQAEIAKAQIGVQQAQVEAQARVQEVQMEAQRAQQDHSHALAQGQMQAGLADQAARQEAASQQMKAQIEAARFERAVAAENAPPKPGRE